MGDRGTISLIIGTILLSVGVGLAIFQSLKTYPAERGQTSGQTYAYGGQGSSLHGL